MKHIKIIKLNNSLLKIEIVEITEKTVAYKNLDDLWNSLKRVTKEEFNNYEIIEEWSI